MSKLIPIAFIATSLILTHPISTLAGTCASKCGPHPIQFTPGQRIRVEVINSTSSLVKLEKLQDTNPIVLQPGQKLYLEPGESTQPNVSLVFWDETGLSLQGIISQPNSGTLRLEIRPSWRYPGDRSLYILNDGRVNVF